MAIECLAKVTTHLAVLQNMPKEKRSRYQHLNILGCFALPPRDSVCKNAKTITDPAGLNGSATAADQAPQFRL
jgi:hypothetical protein